MANRDMKVSVLVQLVDRLTAPLRGMTNAIAGVANRVADLGRRIGVVGAALAALSFTAPLQQAAAWDAQLRDIAITAGETGGAVEKMIAETSLRYEKLALQVGQRSGALAEGAQLLIAAGMESSLIDRLMPTIGRVSTAANAELKDTARTAFALNETLKIGSDQMELALAKLVTAGKLGRFEFKNMASEFPSLTAQMAKLGITGMEAVNFLGSSLQIAMLGTDSPSEAANNLKNFLTKINAPEAIKKFEKELKVDVTGVMTDATAKGINPIEAVIQKMTDKIKVPKAEIDKILKQAGTSGMSDKEAEKAVRQRIEQLIAGTKVGKLYADMQVLDFLIPMLLNTAKFKEMKQAIAQSGIDVVTNDFESRMRGLSGQMMLFSEVGTQAMRRIGLAFASNLPVANQALQELLKWVASVDAKWPGLIDGVLSWTGALLVLGAGLALLTPVVSALAAAVGLLFSPITLIVLALAALGYAAWYVYQNWEQIGPKLKAAWDAMAQAFADAWSGIKQAFADAWAGIEQKGAELVEWGRALPGRLMEALGNLGSQLKQAGLDAIQGLWDGMSAKFDELIAWVAGNWASLTSIFKLPSIGGGAPSKGPGEPGLGTMDGFNPTSAPGGVGGQSGFTRTAGGPAANSNVQVGGRIVVEASEGTRVVNVQSENPAVPVTPNRGTMVARP